MNTEAPPERPLDTWLALLVHELFQTEESARDHCRVEADRLGDCPPAQVLREVSLHAGDALVELPPLMRRHDLPAGIGGRRVGAALSGVRDYLADVLLSAEKSYRATLLGMRHGVDCIELLMDVAERHGDLDLAAWAELWLERRRPLVEAAARELAWFADHPGQATAPAKPDNALARGIHAFLDVFGRAVRRLRHAGEDLPLHARAG